MKELIQNAIRNRRALSFTYHGKRRLFQPHAMGENKEGRFLLAGFQYAGASKNGKLPGWRDFFVDEVKYLQLLPDTFSPHKDYDPKKCGIARMRISVN